MAIVTNVGAGSGGRDGVGREMWSQGGLSRERLTARRTYGADAYGKTVWSWHPWLVSSRRRFWQGPTGLRRIFNPPAMEARRIRLQGERGISRKAIAQGMPGCSGCTCMLVCASISTLHTRPRVLAGTRHSLLPLILRERTFSAKLGRRAPRDRGILSQMSPPVIASEAKQSILSSCRDVDCFASLAMTLIGRATPSSASPPAYPVAPADALLKIPAAPSRSRRCASPSDRFSDRSAA